MFSSKVIKIIKRTITLISLLVVIFYATAFLMPKKVLHTLLEKEIAAISNGKASINGDVSIVLTPLPMVVADNIFISIDSQQFVRLTNCSYQFNPLSMLGAKVSSIEIGVIDANIDLNNLTQGSKDLLKTIKALNQISVKSGIVTINDSDGKKHYLDNIDFKVFKDGKFSSNYKLHTKFSVNNNPYRFNATFDDGIISSGTGHLKLSSGIWGFLIDLNGDLTNAHESPSFDGQMNIAIDKSTEFDRSTLTMTYLLLSMLDASFSGNIKADQNKVSAPELLLTSSLANSGTLAINYLNQDSNNLQVNLSIPEINITSANIASGPTLLPFLEGFIKTFEYTMPKFLDGTVIISADKISINNSVISNLDFGAQISDGKAVLKKFTAKIDDTGSFSINGTLSNNDIRPKFEGSVYVLAPKLESLLGLDQTVGELVLDSNFVFIPRVLRFDRIKAVVGDTMLKGSIFLRDASKHIIDVNLDLTSSAINSDSLGLTESFDNMISTLYTYDFDKTGQIFDSQIASLNDFQNLNFNVTAEIFADKFTFRNTDFKKFHARFSAKDGTYNISDISAANDRLDFSIAVSLDSIPSTPVLNIDSKFNKADLEILEFLLPNISNLKKIQKTTVDKLLGEKKIATSILTDSASLSDLNFFSLQNFDGSIKLWFNQITLFNTQLQNLKLNSTLASGSAIIDELSAQVFNGDAKLNGSIFLADKISTIKLNASLNNISPKELMWYQLNYAPIDGYLSIAANLNASGYNYNDLLNNTTITAQLLGKQITLNGFNFVGFAKLVDSDTPLQNKILAADSTIQSQSTTFDNLSGKLEFAKGVWSLTDFSADNNRLTGSYSGSFVPSTSEIVSAGIISFIPYNAQKAINLPIKSTGTLTNQVVTYDISQFVSFMKARASSAEKSALDSMQQKPTPESDTRVLRK